MRILITGCLGFIGSNLTKYLLTKGHEIVGVDNCVNQAVAPSAIGKFKFLKADINDPHLKPMLSAYDHKFDAVIHLAAWGSVPRSFKEPDQYVLNNERGFEAIMRLAWVLKCPTLVYASSSSVYGSNLDSVKVEGKEGQAMSPYAHSKKMNEAFARMHAQEFGIKAIGLRFFNVYGPNQRHDSMYSAVIPKFIHTDTPEVYGDGESARDFTFVSDVCVVIEKALACPHSTVLNVGTGKLTTIHQLLELLGKKDKAVHLPKRKGDVSNSCASTKLLEQTLYYKPETPLHIGLGVTKKMSVVKKALEQEVNRFQRG